MNSSFLDLGSVLEGENAGYFCFCSIDSDSCIFNSVFCDLANKRSNFVEVQYMLEYSFEHHNISHFAPSEKKKMFVFFLVCTVRAHIRKMNNEHISESEYRLIKPRNVSGFKIFDMVLKRSSLLSEAVGLYERGDA